MKPVIRRILFLGLAVFLLSACGATERTALAVGDQSISEDGLTELVVAVNGGLPIGEEPASLPADRYRVDGAVWLQLASRIDYLNGEGVTITEEEEDTIKLEIENAISTGQIGPVDRDSEAWEAFVWSFWLGSRPIEELATPEAERTILLSLVDSTVSSRVGELDLDTLAITSLNLLPRG